MKTTRRAVLGAGVGLMGLTLAGCGLSGGGGSAEQDKAAKEAKEGKVEGEISFQTWSLKNEKFTPYFEDLVARFEKENPGVEVKWMDQPGEGYEDKLLGQANSGALPDVVNVPPNFAYSLAKNGMLLDLAKADDKLKDMYVEGGIKAYEMPGIDGSYGYPWYLGTDMSWWNIDALSKFGVSEDSLPTTFDELYDLAMEAAKQGGSAPIISSLPEIIITSGDDGKFNFNTDENVDFLQKYVELYKAKAMPVEVLSDNYTGNAQLYKQEKVLWTTATSSYPTELKTDNPGLIEKTVVTKRMGQPPLFVQGIAVSAKSKAPAAALAFAKFATNTEDQIEFVKLAQGFLPGTKEAAADPSKFAEKSDIELQNKAVELAAESMKTAVDPTNVMWTEDMKTNMGQQMALAMRGDITAKQALDAAVKYGNDQLS